MQVSGNAEASVRLSIKCIKFERAPSRWQRQWLGRLHENVLDQIAQQAVNGPLLRCVQGEMAVSRILRIIFTVVIVSLTSVPVTAEEGPSPDDIAFVQGLLTRFGYDPGPIVGICGNQTTAAVRAFHDDRDLPLQPGEIEPQAATVVANLTSHFARHVLEPEKTTPAVYEKALVGDADAAREVGLMYRNGEAVAADQMMAYAWWTVAETYGNADAAKLKADLAANSDITDHEMGYASALAEQICASADLKNGKTPQPDDDAKNIRGREATM
ncbi:MAG: peptidoglycan-binding protein [Geminicoccaceae bacterium]